jgi:hypothetical protein
LMASDTLSVAAMGLANVGTTYRIYTHYTVHAFVIMFAVNYAWCSGAWNCVHAWTAFSHIYRGRCETRMQNVPDSG